MMTVDDDWRQRFSSMKFNTEMQLKSINVQRFILLYFHSLLLNSLETAFQFVRTNNGDTLKERTA